MWVEFLDFLGSDESRGLHLFSYYTEAPFLLEVLAMVWLAKSDYIFRLIDDLNIMVDSNPEV